MSGRYLRRKADGPRDPTMTHVDDPRLFHVGDYVRSYAGWSIIVAIDDNVFGDPDTRFAHLTETNTRPDRADVVHDFRPLDVENFHLNAVSVTTGKRPDWTMEEARKQLERDLAAHMNGFVP